MAEAIHQLAKSQCFFDGVQIGALNVLDNRNLENLGIIKVAHDDRKFVKLRNLGGPPPAFTRHDFEAVCARNRPHDKRLDDPFLTQRRGKILQALGRKVTARLQWIWHQLFDRNHQICTPGTCAAAYLRVQVYIRHERRKTAPEAATLWFLIHLCFPFRDARLDGGPQVPTQARGTPRCPWTGYHS